MRGSCFQLLHCFKIIFRGGAAQCFQHTARELEGRRGGQHHHGHPFALFLCSHMEGHCGVRIAQVVVLLIAGTDLPCHFFLTAPAAGEVLLNGSQRLRTHSIAAGLGKALHQARHLGITAGDMVQKALEVRGHQNVHAGRGGLEELPLCGVGAGGEEIGQHVVLIGSADQLAHGQAHALCIVACQNVAEVAGRYAEVHFIAEGDPARLEQLGIGGKVIDDLRHQTAPVDGVGAGQADVPLGKLCCNGSVTKDLLHTGLCIIKVAAHSVHCHVGTLLRCHLQALDLAGTARGIEHCDLHARDIMVAVQSCLAGIAAGRHKDQGLFRAAQILFGFHQKLRHQLQSIILECTGRAMPQL